MVDTQEVGMKLVRRVLTSAPLEPSVSGVEQLLIDEVSELRKECEAVHWRLRDELDFCGVDF